MCLLGWLQGFSEMASVKLCTTCSSKNTWWVLAKHIPPSLWGLKTFLPIFSWGDPLIPHFIPPVDKWSYSASESTPEIIF